MALSPRTVMEQRRARPEPRITVRTYVTPTSGADVSYVSWAMWRYCTRFPEDVAFADLVEVRHHGDGLPLVMGAS